MEKHFDVEQTQNNSSRTQTLPSHRTAYLSFPHLANHILPTKTEKCDLWRGVTTCEQQSLVPTDRRQQIDLPPNVWLPSSVGRASHRYCRGHGFESRLSPDIFQASSFKLPKLENLLRWSFFMTFRMNSVCKGQDGNFNFVEHMIWMKLIRYCPS